MRVRAVVRRLGGEAMWRRAVTSCKPYAHPGSDDEADHLFRKARRQANAAAPDWAAGVGLNGLREPANEGFEIVIRQCSKPCYIACYIWAGSVRRR